MDGHKTRRHALRDHTKVEALEKEDGRRRYVWIDMFCASQNLLAGAFLPSDPKEREALKASNPDEYGRRKEQTDKLFDGAIDSVNEIFFYCSPLADKWLAPPHPFLLPDRGEPPDDWMRQGPGAGTRAWCVYELVKTLAKKCKLYVVLSPDDVDGFQDLLLYRFEEIAKILASIDARDAQISKIDDRAYILGEVEKLDGGLGEVTKTVCAALRDWLAAEAKALVEGMPAGDEGRPVLLNQIGTMLMDQGSTTRRSRCIARR